MEINYSKINEATLRLFKTIYVEPSFSTIVNEADIVELATKGIVFSQKIAFADITTAAEAIRDTIDTYGKDLVKLSNTFHKTWKTVEEIDPATHYLQQIIHYFTTYGFDSLDIPYDESNTYIPAEVIPYPENVTPFNFTIIRPINLDEIIEKLTTLLGTGVALSQQQVDDVITLIDLLQSKGYAFDINMIKNKEVRTILWLRLSKKPYISVDEFLRVLVYKITGSSLLVRSYRDHQAVKAVLSYDKQKQKEVAKLLEEYTNMFGMENIASQFLRNKMIFLGLKCDATKTLINQIRRAAIKYHKPMHTDMVLTDEAIESASIWQLIKYYNYCSSKYNPTKDMVYKIRNGKNYLKDNSFNYEYSDRMAPSVEGYAVLKDKIKDRISEELSHLVGKNFVIPDYIDYAVPTSLKRLLSGVPENTVLTFPEDKSFTVGVHWTNLIDEKHDREDRVDLDLHASALDGRSIGWCNDFRNDEAMYSGDMTDAPIDKNGASEAITFNNITSPYLVTLNNFTQHVKVPYKFIFDLDTHIGDREPRGRSNGYIFSQNARTLDSSIGISQNTLGLVIDNHFYFMNSSMFNGPITYNSDLLKRAIEYYKESRPNILTFKQLANIVGFNIYNSIDEVPTHISQILEDKIIEEKDEYIDLSLEAITEDTFPSIFEKVQN